MTFANVTQIFPDFYNNFETILDTEIFNYSL